MQRPKLVPPAEIRSVLNDLAKGDIEVFGKLQPRLYTAMPMTQKRVEEPAKIIIKSSISPSEERQLLEAAAVAASRGLTLVSQGASSNSSSGLLSADSQGLLCIARCCVAMIAFADLHSSSSSSTKPHAALVEVAVAVQSAGAPHNTVAAASWMTNQIQLWRAVAASALPALDQRSIQACCGSQGCCTHPCTFHCSCAAAKFVCWASCSCVLHATAATNSCMRTRCAWICLQTLHICRAMSWIVFNYVPAASG